LGPHPQLFNAIVNGQLYQFRATESIHPDDSFPEDVRVAGNTTTFLPSNTTEDGVVASNSTRTIVQGNTIGSEAEGANVRTAIRAGGLSGPPGVGLPRQYPGHCSEKSERYCLSNFDCNIPEIDESSADACLLPPVDAIFWFTQDAVFADNTIFGRFGTALATTAQNTLVRGNEVFGMLPSGPTRGPALVHGGKKSLETSVVQRNKISDVVIAVQFSEIFQGEGPAFFGVEFSLNDITGYTTALTTSNGYSLASELSVEGRGNYWGLPCPPGFDPASIRKDNGELQPAVVDSFPFAGPVAEVPEDLLPELCI